MMIALIISQFAALVHDSDSAMLPCLPCGIHMINE